MPSFPRAIRNDSEIEMLALKLTANERHDYGKFVVQISSLNVDFRSLPLRTDKPARTLFVRCVKWQKKQQLRPDITIKSYLSLCKTESFLLQYQNQRKWKRCLLFYHFIGSVWLAGCVHAASITSNQHQNKCVSFV